MAKRVVFRDGKDDTNSKIIFQQALETAPQGMGFAEMRKRHRVLDALAAAKGPHVDLEDADHATLKASLEAVQGYQRVPHDMMGWMIQVQDDVNGASAPPPAPTSEPASKEETAQQ